MKIECFIPYTLILKLRNDLFKERSWSSFLSQNIFIFSLASFKLIIFILTTNLQEL